MADQTYRPPLRGLFKLILSAFTELINLFVPRIKDDELRQMAGGMLQSGRRTIEALSDADPNDKAQLQEILNDLLRAGDFQAGAKAEISQAIGRLDDENVRLVLNVVNNQAWIVADRLTDDDPANSQQMRAYLVDLLKSQDGVAFLRGLLALVLPGQTADTITLIVLQLIISQLEEDGDASGVLGARLREIRETYQQRLAA